MIAPIKRVGLVVSGGACLRAYFYTSPLIRSGSREGAAPAEPRGRLGGSLALLWRFGSHQRAGESGAAEVVREPGVDVSPGGDTPSLRVGADHFDDDRAGVRGDPGQGDGLRL